MTSHQSLSSTAAAARRFKLFPFTRDEDAAVAAAADDSFDGWGTLDLCVKLAHSGTAQ